MSRSLVFLGEISGDEVLDQWRSLSPNARDGLIVGAAFILVIASIILWAVYIRKPKRPHHTHHRHHHHSSSADVKSNETGEQAPQRRKWRRPRRPHRQMNPTLAETGGLPPMRDQRPPNSPF